MKARTSPIELKSLDPAAGTFTGYAAKFGNVDHGGDIILPGAFKNFLVGKDVKSVPVLWQHSWDDPIGTTMTMSEDAEGLLVAGKLVMEVQRAREAKALAEAGALGGLSIGFKATDWSWENGVRVLKQIDLMEYSMVTFPMNEKAVILDVKAQDLKSLRDCEAYLRDALGLSRTEAKTLISRIRGASEDAHSEEAHLDALRQSIANLNKNL
jgi:uncharacterized protein